MLKRGQVTLFIILGILLLLSVGIILYLNFYLVKEDLSSNIGSTSTGKVSSVKLFVENCHKKSLTEGVQSLALNGGYFETITLSSSFYHIPYYFYQGTDLSPNKAKMEQQLSDYIKQEIITCTQNFSVISYDLVLGNVSVVASIDENSVSSKLNWPIKINLDGSQTEISSFNEKINVRLGLLYNLAKNITSNQVNRTGLCISCLSDLAEKNKIQINVDNLYNDELVIILSDNSSKLSSSDNYFRFAFAFRYLSDNITDNFLTESVRIYPPENVNATVGSLFQYLINASGQGLTYWDQTDLFDIDSITGLIKFTPTEKQAGNHTIWIWANDSKGNEDFTNFNLEVRNE